MSRDPLWRALGLLRPSPVRFGLAVLLGTATLAAAIALLGTSGWLIVRAAQQPPVLYLMVAVVAVRALGIGRGVLRYGDRLTSHDVALRGVVTLRETVYRRLATADTAVTAGLRRGDLLARVGADVDTLGDLVVRSLLPFATAALTGLLTVGAVAAFLPAAAVILATSLLVAGGVAPALAAYAARRAEQDAARSKVAASAEVMALLDGLAELSVAGVAKSRLGRLERHDVALGRQLDRAARPAALAALLSTLATGLGMVGVVAVCAGSPGLRPVLLAAVVLVSLAAAEIIAPLPAAAVGLVRSRQAAQRIMELIDAGHEGTPAPRQRATSTVHRLRAVGLCCGWPGRPTAVRGLDLDLTAGRRIAIVGPSGCGKTTLLLTLAGLLPPVAGTVAVEADGDTDPDLRSVAHLCADDAHVFATTLRENLRVAAPAGTPDSTLLDAVHDVGLGAWYDGLPAGLATVLGSGVGAATNVVSGGERRRLLLARALLTTAPVLLLDEPAEHLDPGTADELVTAFLRGGDATKLAVVVVTHRLAPLAAADEILVIADGQVAARGDQAWLLAHHQPYQAEFLAQGNALSTMAHGQVPARTGPSAP